MRKVLWVVFAAGLLSGCKKEEPAATAGPRQEAEAGREEAPGTGADPFDDSKPYVLTREKLDAYVSYQRTVQSAYAAVARELQAARARFQEAPGTPAQGQGRLSESMKAIESKAELEDKARRDVGLSEQDVNRIGSLVMDVITQRHMAAMLDLSGELQKLEQMQARLKPEQAAELAPQIDAMRLRLQETEKLASVRKVHGDANVDLVLTREQDLMTNYQDMLRSFGGRAQ
ncbi:putative lipoprotein [Cystobacter fuscus DSM 2262]|uniref:Lipoprotein n=1 Tax=Cystobacter fuscus (strain ATCC 25194 / DSM 2262 / NBRC 100088 / M29) TaxID=1242864 RepID=S9PJS8_CYSF2|nr:hypothetical protein [Cystobacter fuscus]EPX62677.1 putative lipoprotein [Cystobacter fuscus DSM 2262]